MVSVMEGLKSYCDYAFDGFGKTAKYYPSDDIWLGEYLQENHFGGGAVVQSAAQKAAVDILWEMDKAGYEPKRRRGMILYSEYPKIVKMFGRGIV